MNWSSIGDCFEKSPPFEGGVTAPIKKMLRSLLIGADELVRNTTLTTPSAPCGRVHPSFKRRGLFLTLAIVLFACPAFAQVDLSGEWGQKMHEDAPERGGGPTIGDYTGLPINDRARLQADSWDAG